MHVHLPKPLHDWREFMRELGIKMLDPIIVMGVGQLADAARGARHCKKARRETALAAKQIG